MYVWCRIRVLDVDSIISGLLRHDLGIITAVAN